MTVGAHIHDDSINILSFSTRVLDGYMRPHMNLWKWMGMLVIVCSIWSLCSCKDLFAIQERKLYDVQEVCPK